MTNKHQRNDERDFLPPELQALHRQLQADSAAWSHRVPSPDHLINRFRIMVGQQHATQIGTSDVDDLHSRPPVLPERGYRYMHSPQQRIGVAFTVLIIVAAIFGFVVLHNYHAGNKGSPVSRATATPVGDSIPTTWTHVSALDYRGQYINMIPAIAPSDPQVVYETYPKTSDNQVTGYRRTDDGGKTWHELTLPVPNNTGKTYFRTYVSPLDPKVIFLEVFEGTAVDCPRNYLTTVGALAGPYCAIQFMSTDAGEHWSFQRLPFNGTFVDTLFSNQRYLHAQGNRLYAGEYCYDKDCDNILTSTDGGKSWKVISAPLVANGHTLCDFNVAANGSTIIAVTSAPQTGSGPTTECYGDGTNLPTPLTLWQSDDAGATWQNDGTLPTVLNRGTAVTDDNTGRPLIYSHSPAIAQSSRNKDGHLNYFSTFAPSDVKVTADSGKTWTNAPSAGVPATMGVVGLVGTLQDGSILIECAPLPEEPSLYLRDDNGSTYFYWKRGDTSWHQLGNATIGNLQALVVTPDTTRIGKVWLMISGMGSIYGNVYEI
jgi:hypothetical protein